MRIALVRNTINASSAPDEQDVLYQTRSVQASLHRLGHVTLCRECGLDLEHISRLLSFERPDLVFNLVETLNGTGRMIHFFPGLLEALAIPFTGASADALFWTSNKLAAKLRLRAAGLPTPDWLSPRGGFHQPAVKTPDVAAAQSRWIVKSVWEHASIGLDQQSVVAWDGAERLYALLEERAVKLGGTWFGEVFVDGREFNLAMLEGPEGVEILPPAEIRFDGFGTDRARIVDYRAKWDTQSFEYHHTRRNFDFVADDRKVLGQLRDLAAACWDLFDLQGYARVDFRVDKEGQPWILEVNANPCLAPDGGFAATLEEAGLSYTTAIGRIVAAASRV